MKLGEKQVLTVVKIVDFGVYLGNDEERVLLPKKQVPQGIEVGDPIEVFLYKDSSDRMIATTNEPKLTIGKTAVLEAQPSPSLQCADRYTSSRKLPASGSSPNTDRPQRQTRRNPDLIHTLFR